MVGRGRERGMIDGGKIDKAVDEICQYYRKTGILISRWDIERIISPPPLSLFESLSKKIKRNKRHNKHIKRIK
jgi:hypothetical protein